MVSRTWVLAFLVAVASSALPFPSWASGNDAKEKPSKADLAVGTVYGATHVGAIRSAKYVPLVAGADLASGRLDPASPYVQWYTVRKERIASLEHRILLKHRDIAQIVGPETRALEALASPSPARGAMIRRAIAKRAPHEAELNRLTRELRKVKAGDGLPPRVRAVYRVAVPAVQLLLAMNLAAGAKTMLLDQEGLEPGLDRVLPAVYQGKKLLMPRESLEIAPEAEAKSSGGKAN